MKDFSNGHKHLKSKLSNQTIGGGLTLGINIGIGTSNKFEYVKQNQVAKRKHVNRYILLLVRNKPSTLSIYIKRLFLCTIWKLLFGYATIIG